MTESNAQRCLVVGTPCYGRQVTDVYVGSLLKLQLACQARDIKLRVHMLGSDALITRARQDIVARFMEDETATHLLFIDADIGFEPEQVFRLMDLDAGVAAAIYPIKSIDWEKVAACVQSGRLPLQTAALSYMIKFQDAKRIELREGFARVDYAGTGFLMIQRHVLMSMIEQYPELRYAHEHKPNDSLGESPWRYALFNCLIDTESGTYLSEDFSFCYRWTAMGGEIWADLQSRLTHVGAFSFTGDVGTQFTTSPVGE